MDRGRGGGPGGAAFNRRGMPKSLAGPAAEFMPQNIRLGFIPRPPLEYKPPVALAHTLAQAGAHAADASGAGTGVDGGAAAPAALRPKGAASLLSGIGSVLPALASHMEAAASSEPEHDASRAERRARALAQNAARIEEELQKWDPKSDPKISGDEFKTLFVGRLAYETTERKLQKEFSEYGPVKQVTLIKDHEGNSRGYGFVEFEHEDDMRKAYRGADGKRIDGRRILVDVERGRTVRGWRPRRLGGGLGDTRKETPRKPCKKDTWIRPMLVDYGILSVTTKAAREAAQQAAIAAAFAANEGRFAGMGVPGVPGYSARFEDRYREVEKAKPSEETATNGEGGATEAQADGAETRERAYSRDREGVEAEMAAAAAEDKARMRGDNDEVFAAAAALPAAVAIAEEDL